jgi:hypothetical protein
MIRGSVLAANLVAIFGYLIELIDQFPWKPCTGRNEFAASLTGPFRGRRRGGVPPGIYRNVDECWRRTCSRAGPLLTANDVCSETAPK